MVILFSEEERKYIDASGEKWKIKSGCPERVKKTLKRKIYMLQTTQKKAAMRG